MKSTGTWAKNTLRTQLSKYKGGEGKRTQKAQSFTGGRMLRGLLQRHECGRSYAEVVALSVLDDLEVFIRRAKYHAEYAGEHPVSALEEYITKNCWDIWVLGSGHFSIAVRCSDYPWVFKISINEDDAGVEYQKLCAVATTLGKAKRFNMPEIYAVVQRYGVVCAVSPEYSSIGSEEDTAPPDINHLDSMTPLKLEESRGLPMVAALAAATYATGWRSTARFDIHCGNVMLDAQGEPVLNDPLSFTRHTRNKVRVASAVKALVRAEQEFLYR